MASYDAGATAANPTATLPDDPERLWTTSVSEAVRTGPVADADAVYVVNEGRPMHERLDLRCYAMDARSGGVRWRFDLGPIGVRALAVVDGVVYTQDAGAVSRSVVALDAADGSDRWKAELPSNLQALSVTEDVVYAATADELIALDAADGAERWRAAVDPVPAQPAVGDDAVVVASEDGTVRSLALDSGNERWRYDLGGTHCPPATLGGLVFAASRGQLAAIDDGEAVWRYEPPARFESGGLAVDGEHVYVGGSVLSAVDAATGDRRWTADVAAGPAVNRAPSVADGRVWAVDADGGISAVDVDDGTIAWTGDAPEYVVGRPAIAEGGIYLATERGQTVAFGAPEE